MKNDYRFTKDTQVRYDEYYIVIFVKMKILMTNVKVGINYTIWP